MTDQHDDEIQTIIHRIIKLSEKPDNPGMAYRHMEMIHTLSQKLLPKLAPHAGTDES